MRQTPDNQIRRKLARTAMLLRLFAITRAVLLMVVCCELFLWVSIGLDYFFVLSKGTRRVLLALAIAMGSALVIRALCLQVFRKIPWTQLATLYERRVPELGESLLTVITDPEGSWNRKSQEPESDTSGSLHDHLLNRTTCYASDILARVRIASVFNWTNIVALAGGTILLTALTAMTVYDRTDLKLLFSRAVCLSDERPPSRTILLLNGTKQQAEFFVRQGDSFELRIAATVLRGRPVREIEVITLPNEAGNQPQTLRCRRFREEVVKEPDKSGVSETAVSYRVFTVNFTSILSSMNLTVRGGDAESTCRIHVVKPPVIVSAQVRHTFPDYMRRDVLIEPLSSVHAVPEGTSLVFEFECDKALKTILTRPESVVQVRRVAGKENCFTIETEALYQLLQFEVHLSDQAGIAPRQPLGIHIELIPDRVPVVKGAIRGVGRRITPLAVIPYAVSVTDDYGINSLLMGVRKGTSSQWESMKLTTLVQHEREYSTQGVCDASYLPLKPGDTLSLRITASDRKPVRKGSSDGFQTGSGPVWDFEIVEPVQLKELLEVEEYGYRDRLVNLIRQSEQTKELVSGVGVQGTSQTIPWSRVLRDLQKDMFDAGQIAKGITSLCDEIRNNRLCPSSQMPSVPFDLSGLLETSQSQYFPGHLEELQTQVVSPLESLVEKEFAPLCKRLTVFNAPGPTERKEIIASIDRIISGLNNVLVHMRSLQSFRELVDEFHKIRVEFDRSRRTTDQKKDELFHELEK